MQMQFRQAVMNIVELGVGVMVNVYIADLTINEIFIMYK